MHRWTDEERAYPFVTSAFTDVTDTQARPAGQGPIAISCIKHGRCMHQVTIKIYQEVDEEICDALLFGAAYRICCEKYGQDEKYCAPFDD